MSNEEQAVLDFFAKPENLPLALSVGEQVDRIRQQLINAFWSGTGKQLETLPGWKVELTEDRTCPGNLVGLALHPVVPAPACLRPMLEQQLTEHHLRIYVGLMWNALPAANLTALPEVAALQQALQASGYKHNENFLGWRWSNLYPMRRGFLLRCSDNPSEAIQEGVALLDDFLVRHADLVNAANQSLAAIPPSTPISLDRLRAHHAP